MSVPGINCIMSSYSLQGEQRLGFDMCLYVAFPVMYFHLSEGEQKGGLTCVRTRLSMCHVLYLSQGK